MAGRWFISRSLQGETEAKRLKGIQEGILEGVLQRTITAAQFCVCPDQTNRANVIESYTFRFHYREGDDQSGRELAGLALTGTGPSSIPITNARDGLNELIRLIVSYTKKMPDLPGTSMTFAEAWFQNVNAI